MTQHVGNQECFTSSRKASREATFNGHGNGEQCRPTEVRTRNIYVFQKKKKKASFDVKVRLTNVPVEGAREVVLKVNRFSGFKWDGHWKRILH